MRKRTFDLLVLILVGSLAITTIAAQSGRVRQHGDSGRPAAEPARDSPSAGGKQLIPKGTIIELRLDRSLSSKSNTKGEEFTTTVAEPVVVDGHLMLTTDAVVKCHIINVQPAARKRSNGSLTIGFDELVLINGEKIPLHATLVSIADRRDDVVDKSGEGQIKDSSKSKNAPVTIGTSAGVGATVGAIGGGAAGAGVGGAVGAGVGLGSVLLSKGYDVELLSGYRLQIKLDADLSLANSPAQ